MLFDDGFLQNWRVKPKYNEQRKGSPTISLSEFLNVALLLATIHANLLRYRQLEGFLRMMSEHIKRLQKSEPNFTTIWRRRIVKMKIKLDPKVNLERDDVVIAVDIQISR